MSTCWFPSILILSPLLKKFLVGLNQLFPTTFYSSIIYTEDVSTYLLSLRSILRGIISSLCLVVALMWSWDFLGLLCYSFDMGTGPPPRCLIVLFLNCPLGPCVGCRCWHLVRAFSIRHPFCQFTVLKISCTCSGSCSPGWHQCISIFLSLETVRNVNLHI